MKRKNYIFWDEFFMGVAKLASKRSKDPSTRHGACIVKDNKILSVGYNGLPNGLDDNGYDIRMEDGHIMCPEEGLEYDYWKKSNKDNFVVHAELNAIINAKCDLEGSTLYLYSEKGYYPCKICAGAIDNSDIKEVVMETAIVENTDTYNWEPTKHIFSRAGIKLRVLKEK